MELSIYNIQGEDTGRKIALESSVFGIEPNDHAIYLTVKQYRANQRQGTHKTKAVSYTHLDVYKRQALAISLAASAILPSPVTVVF